MGVLAETYRPGDVERTARELWTARGLPRPDGVLGRSSSPILRQFEGALITGDDPGLVAFRAVAADVDARYLALAGRRALGTLRRDGEPDETTLALLRALSVWTGGAAGAPVDTVDRRAGVEAILGRMAGLGLVATRDTSLRVCSTCAQARTPERIVYQQEEGDTYLVRFALPEADGPVHALVWVDAPWRLLGASALLINPNLPYVVARYRRRGVDEKILTSRPSLSRLLEWLPGGEIEVLDEGPGSRWQGRAYQYPLRHEFPMGGELTPPSGTVLAVPDVTDSGTGIVPLVPGHGGTDAQIADRLGIAGWPLVTARGQLDFNLAHKYSGLDITTANEFVARDLGEGGALFARLRVRRGVPHCSICGTALVWAPGRAWCLEPSRLPPERRDLFRRLLPREPPVGQVEVAAWPISEPQSTAPGPTSVTLLECPRCERLAPLSAGPMCPCGNRRDPVSRRLLPSILGVLGAWARLDPFPAGDSVWLYLNERRRAPALVHHLAAMSGVPGVPQDVGLSLLPGVPEGGVAELVGSVGADAVRAALVQGERRERSGPTFPDRCRQEARRLERWWHIVRETLDRCDPALLALFAQAIAGSLGELEPEDRALLARWERVRLASIADYDHQAAGSAHRRITGFLSNDLETYWTRVRPRLERAGTPPSRRAALRTLHHVLRGVSVVLAPVSPHVAETVYGALVPGRTSVFETTIDPLDAALLDEEAIKAWDRWASVEAALNRFRRRVGLEPETPIPSLAAVVGSDDLAGSLRNDRPTIQRLCRIVRFDAFGPATPWTGRQRTLEPVLAEIQKAYPQEAGQIVHLLRRSPPRRRGEAGSSEELSVVVRGLSRRILPSMVEYVETVPERTLPLPWTLGELYVELPGKLALPNRNPPPVSPDAFRLLARVEHALSRAPPPEGGVRGPVVIAVLDPLATELRSSSRAIAAYLDVPEVRVVDPGVDFPRANCLFGRTRTGVHWWVRLAGVAPRVARGKLHVPRPRLSRVRTRRPGTLGISGEVDFASPELVAKEEQIRSLVQELDGVLGAPLLGPAKISVAWDAGFHTLEDFTKAPFERIDRLRGFSGPISERLVRKLGGTVPPRSARPRYPAADSSEGITAAIPAPTVSESAPYVELVPPETPILTDRGKDARGGGSRTPETGAAPKADSRVPGIPSSVAAAPIPVPLSKRDTPRPAAPAIVPIPTRATASPTGAVPLIETPLPPPDVPIPATLPPESSSVDGGSAAPQIPRAPSPIPTEPDLRESASSPVHVETTSVSGSDPTAALGLVEPTPERGAESAFPTPSLAQDLPRPEPAASEVTVPAFDVASPVPDMDTGTAGVAPPPNEEPGVPEAPAALPLALPDLDAGPATGPELDAESAKPDPDGAHRVADVPLQESGTTAEVTTGPLDRSGQASGPEKEDRPDDAAPAGPSEPSGPPTEAVAPGMPGPMDEVAPSVEPAAGLELGETADGSGTPGLEDLPSPVVPAGVPAEASAPVIPEPVMAEPTVSEGSAEPGVLPIESVPERSETEPELAPEPEPVPPTPVAPPEVVPLPPPTPSGGVTLIVAPSYLPAFAHFLDATAAGHRGICVVRESPDRLRAHIGPRPVEIYWLTTLGRGLTLRPNDLDGYSAFLQKALEQDRVTAFFLEGIEYLTRVHGTERVIERLTAFHIAAQAHNARVWVYLHPDLIPAADLALFSSAFGSGALAD